MDTVLTILYFIIGLLVLVTLHEFGHFIVAKIFNVYCFEFSICFGKKVIRRKKKYAETYFCLGVIPLGGYVSMLGEDADETEKNAKENEKQEKVEDENEEHLSFTVIDRKKYRLFKKQNKLIKLELERLNNAKLRLDDIVAQERLIFENKITIQEANELIARHKVQEKLGLDALVEEKDFYKEVDENHLPTDRDLEHVNRGKKFAIMSAGIIMNFIIGYILYVISYSCFPNVSISLRLEGSDDIPTGVVTPFKNQLEDLNDGLDDQHAFAIKGKYIVYEDDLWNESFNVNTALGGGVIKDGEKTTKVMAVANNTFNLTDLSLDNQLYKTVDKKNIYNFYEIVVDDTYGLFTWDQYKELNKDKIASSAKIQEFFKAKEEGTLNIKDFILVRTKSYQLSKENAKIDSVDLTIPMIKATINDNVDGGISVNKDETPVIENLNGTLVMNQDKGLLDSTYINFTSHERWLGADSFKYASHAWADGTTAVFRAVGNLFVGQGWDSIGGPIAMLTQSSIIFKNNPFSVYIRMWGLISVNLAVMNLLPFPGLDGWHLLVTTIEAVTRKKINRKFKEWSSRIGLMLLFGLMIAVFALDIVRCAGIAL